MVGERRALASQAVVTAKSHVGSRPVRVVRCERRAPYGRRRLIDQARLNYLAALGARGVVVALLGLIGVAWPTIDKWLKTGSAKEPPAETQFVRGKVMHADGQAIQHVRGVPSLLRVTSRLQP